MYMQIMYSFVSTNQKHTNPSAHKNTCFTQENVRWPGIITKHTDANTFVAIL